MGSLKNMLETGLKNMKESKLVDEAVPASDSDDHYPYGLRLDLSDKSLEKLNIDVTKLKVGEEVRLIARAEVIAVRSNKSEYGDNENVELQVTHLAFDEDED